jgi:hypothetical protein
MQDYLNVLFLTHVIANNQVDRVIVTREDNIKMIRNIVRWFLFLGFLALALLYLNSAMYSSWLANGPPTKNPQAWEIRALRHFGFSISLFASGVMLLFGLKINYNWRKSKYKYIWLILLLVCLGYPKAVESLLIHRCNSSGGQWNSETFECRK